MINQNGLDLIKHYEGLRLKAYLDPKIWTIGYGSTYYPDNSRVEEGDVCTLEQAEEYLRDHIAKRVHPQLDLFIKRNSLNWSDNQFGAIYSFCYNLGTSAVILGGKSLNEALLARDKEATRIAFQLYVMAGGKKLEGLIKRRKSESILFCDDKLELF